MVSVVYYTEVAVRTLYHIATDSSAKTNAKNNPTRNMLICVEEGF